MRLRDPNLRHDEYEQLRHFAEWILSIDNATLEGISVRFESTQTQEGVNCVGKFSQFLGTDLGLVWTDCF